MISVYEKLLVSYLLFSCSILQTQTLPFFYSFWFLMPPEEGPELNSTSDILHHRYWERSSVSLPPIIHAVFWKFSLKSHVFGLPLALDSQSPCMWKLQAFPQRSCNVSASSQRTVPLHFPQARPHTECHHLIHPQETVLACTRFHWWVSVHSWRLCIPVSGRKNSMLATSVPCVPCVSGVLFSSPLRHSKDSDLFTRDLKQVQTQLNSM